MGCKRPLTRIVFVNNVRNPLIVKHMSEEEKELNKNNHWIEKIQPIPCGQCAGCRLDYAKQWATRCELEMREWEHNWFVTLTYDDEHLPRKQGVSELGEVIDSNYLVPEHLTKFMKDLRMYWKYHYNEDNIRFYASGEYGEESQRAHYHIILFNCNIRDLKVHHRNNKGNQILVSEEISKIWKQGIVGITKANWETAAYTAKYMLKKQKGGHAKDYYENKGQTPEFCRMSRMPGIAQHWYEEHNEKMWELDEINLANGRTIRPPKYYEDLYDKEIEKLSESTNEKDCIKAEKMKAIKEERKAKREEAAIKAEELKKSKTTLTITELLQAEERTLQQKKGNRIL